MCRDQVSGLPFRSHIGSLLCGDSDEQASLAYAEMRLTLATVLRRFEMENFETTKKDVQIARDYFVGVPEPGSKGVRVTVSKVR